MNTDWHDLIQRQMAGTLDDAESDALQDALKSDAELRRLYLHYMNLDVALEAHATTADTTRHLLMTLPEPITPRGTRWLSWRPLTAAVAGIVFGMFCTSVVYGYVAQRAAVKRMPMPVFDPGFERMKPLDIGLPHNVDEWGVRSAQIVPAENGVLPLQGQRMLRLEPTLLGKQDENLYTHAYQILDVRSLPSEARSGAMEVLVSASFCTTENAKKVRNYIRVYALNEPPGTATEGFWSKTEDAEVVSLTQRFEIEPGDSGWRPFSVKMPLPPTAQSLVIIFSATSPKDETIRAPVSYLDEVQVSLLEVPAVLAGLHP